jgi:hypothetical protein
MCYGNLDPKYAMREADDRLRGVSLAGETRERDAALPAFGLVAWVRAAMARLKRKELRDV